MAKIGRYNFRASRVLDAAKVFTKDNQYQSRPHWLRAAEQVPPSEILTRPYPKQNVALDLNAKRPRRLYRPTKIVYPEDELRQHFYRQHPWELARPKMVLETDGMDARNRDWSTGVKQPGMELSGEW